MAALIGGRRPVQQSHMGCCATHFELRLIVRAFVLVCTTTPAYAKACFVPTVHVALHQAGGILCPMACETHQRRRAASQLASNGTRLMWRAAYHWHKNRLSLSTCMWNKVTSRVHALTSDTLPRPV